MSLEAQLYLFLEKVAHEGHSIPEELLTNFSNSTKRSLKRQFKKRSSSFHLSMSNVGRPLCQLQMEKLGREGEISPSHTFLRNLHGEIIEDIVILLLKAAGIKVIAEQKEVELEIAETTLRGRLDVILEIDGEQSVWDIKSASAWSFANKTSFEALANDDPFGYIPQLVLYAQAARIPAGGWIILDKSTGQITVINFPKESTALREEVLQLVAGHLAQVSDVFRRSFTDKAERFKGVATGKRILAKPCDTCRYKFPCWPGLYANPTANKIVYYTK